VVAVRVVQTTVSAAIAAGGGRVVVIRFREVFTAVLGRVVRVMVMVMWVRGGSGRFALGGIAAAVVVGGGGCGGGGGGCGVLMLRLQ